MDLDPTVLNKIAKECGTSPRQTAATVDLLEEQATIPFIARYRKEATGNLDEPKIRRIAECRRLYKALLDRRQSMLAKIEGQGKLTDDLKNKFPGLLRQKPAGRSLSTLQAQTQRRSGRRKKAGAGVFGPTSMGASVR